ncbi:hypothetical protein Vretimale_4420, partial [Volvox reticuliferus]
HARTWWHSGGNVTETLIVMNDPTSAIRCARKGSDRAAARIAIPSAVRTTNRISPCCPPGTTDCSAADTGSIVNANLAMGLTRMTDAQTAASTPVRLKVMRSSAPVPYM